MDFYKTELKPNTIRRSYMANCIWCGHFCVDSDTCPKCDHQLKIGGSFSFSGFVTSPIFASIENALSLPEIMSIDKAEFWLMMALTWEKINNGR